MHLGVLDLVSGGVPQDHQRVELGESFERLVCTELLRLVDDDDGSVRLDDVDRLAGLEVVQFVVDAPLVLAGGVEGALPGSA